MLHREKALAGRLRRVGSRTTLIVVLPALLFILALGSRVAGIKTEKSEEALQLNSRRSANGKADVARLFNVEVRDLGIGGNNGTVNLSAPMPQAAPTQVKVNFDDVPPFTNIATRYSNVTFSSPGLSVYTWPENFGFSPPQTATRGTIDFAGGVHNNHFADFIITFQQPVNDLKFYITDCDNFGTIALVDIYQNNVLTHPNIAVPGGGATHPPIPFNAQAAGFNNITKVVVHSITDAAGLTYDDFTFTISAPTPTPTPTPSPTPTPPPAPTNLGAVPDEESARLSWSPSTGATGYLVKRTSGDCTSDNPTGANEAAVVAEEGGVASMVIIPVGSTTFTAEGLCSGVKYKYVVSAVGPGGEGANSEPVEVTPLPEPGCDSTLIDSPLPVGSFNTTGGHGWVLDYRFSADSGLELRNISLNGRLMAEWMSVPYFVIAAHNSSSSRESYGQLWANGSNPDGSLRSRLVGYTTKPPNDLLLELEATYAIDRIPGAPRACLKIAVDYEFYKPGKGVLPGLGPASSGDGPCEPSASVPCAKFRPMVRYQFHGKEGEVLDWVNIPQRHHYQVKGTTDNSVGVFLDPDTITQAGRNLGFPEKRNPLTNEFWSPVISASTGTSISAPHRGVPYDNLHQTNHAAVQEPTITRPAGCPECLHNHWRWGEFFGPEWGNGLPLILSPGKQSVDIAVVRYPGKVGSQQRWISLVQGNSLRKPIVEMCRVCIKPIIVGVTGVDPVFWFSPTGSKSSDTFFYHTAWFNPHPPNAPNNPVDIESAIEPPPSTTSGDGPVSVIFGDVYQSGTTTFSNVATNTLPPLPAGYAALGNTGYSINTTALVSGPHTINFSAASVADQSAFENLRMFHLEPDAFDPDRNVWIDTTILSPGTPAPDFASRTLSAQSMDLGTFIIANQVGVLPIPEVADIAVSSSASVNPVTAGNQVTYTIQVTNNGPQMAHEVALRNGLSPDVTFESVTSAQGSCGEIDGTVFCKLNSLNVGETATVAIVVTPTEGTGSLPADGKNFYNNALAKAAEADSNIDNNSATQTTLVLPNPNKAPIINLTSPTSGAMFVGPVTMTINATAIDSDGTITTVEFFDNGHLIGVGTPGPENSYIIQTTLPACQPTPPGSNHPVHENEIPCNVHIVQALATDNGGRQNISNAVNVIVNGTATVNITSPISGALFSPDSQITLNATAGHPSGLLSEVEFFANGQSLGHGTANSSSQYTFAWNNVNAGSYSIFAVARDGSEIPTMSAPVSITVNIPPNVTMNTPTDGAVFPSATNISVSAIAQSTHATIVRVDFFANGVLIGSASDVGTDRFTTTWRNVPDGLSSLTAVATDSLGVSATSPAISIGVNTPSPRPGEFIWFDDALPSGAVPAANDEGWHWVDANPGALSGTKSHQSRNFGQLNPPDSIHQHSFEGATTTFPVNAGDKLFTYVFLDINNMPREIMLQWKDASGWDHRAYWGQNTIDLGTDGTNSRRYIGALPEAGTWVRLEVPANLVGLEGSALNGMAFTLDGGRATFDLAGKTTANAPPPPTTEPGDFVWMEDALPPGAVPAVVDDLWNWVSNPRYSGEKAHVTFFSSDSGRQFRSHSFTGAQIPMQVNPGDVLFTYVHLGDPDPTHPANAPDQIMLQWHDGTSWEHRAFWGVNYIGTRIPNMGVMGTENQRYMGGLPAARGWYRLEVPASYVGLEGKRVSGMAFSSYREQNNPYVAWDQSGKSSALTSVPLTLSSTTGVFRSNSSNRGWAFETPNIAPAGYSLGNLSFHAYPKSAAGTIAFNRFLNQAGNERFYSRFSNHAGWVPAGVAFHVFPDANTPGTVPLHLYRNHLTQYFLTLDQSEAASMGLTYEAIWGYVYTIPPSQPTALTINDCVLNWTDNSNNETGFKIERRVPRTASKLGKKWTEIATVAANVTSFSVACPTSGYYRVRAFNSAWHSAYSNEAWGGGLKDYEPDPPNSAPEVNIVSPVNGETVDQNFAITANAFDIDGNGTIARVEYFANGTRLGEVTEAPHIFPWQNAAPGTYTVSATVTDAWGATTTSLPVTVTVAQVDQSITFEPIPDKTYGEGPFALSATASSGLPVTFAVVSGPATVSGNSLTITGAGTVTVRASQSGDTNYNAAANVDVTFNVAKSSATISLSNLNQTFDGSSKTATATTNPTGLSGVSTTYDGSAIAPTNAGTYSVIATLNNDNYVAPNATATLTVAKANPLLSWTRPADIVVGTALGPSQLNAAANIGGTFTYSPPAGTVLNVGSNLQLSVTFTPADNSNYNSATGNVKINVVVAILLADDYNDNSLDSTKWTIVDASSPVTISEQAQQLRIAIPPNTTAYNGIQSVSTYDLRGATFEVELAQPISQAGWCENFIQAALDANNYLLISAGSGSIVLRSRVNGVNDQTVSAFEPTTMRFWRIRHDQASNIIYFETSPDRDEWTARMTVPPGFSLSGLRISLYAGAWGTGNANPGAANWDNLQLAANVVQQPPDNVVISQIYGGGGNSGATYRNDYVELFNRGTTTVDLNGWTIQYASATGDSWQITNLQGSLAPGHYYLIQQAQGAAGTQVLPAPDATGSIAMNATSGKVALLNGEGCLNVNPGGWDCEWEGTRIIDLVGYGSQATTYEGDGPTVSSSNTTGVFRGANGCIDLNDNRSDFDSGAPSPRNTSAAVNTCSPANPSNSIVISEFRTRGPNGGNDEFIELYNKSAAPIDISGWRIKGSSNTASVSTRVTVGSNTVIPAHGHFLVTNVASAGYSGTRVGDQTYTVGIVDNGGIAITRADDTIVDQVGMSSGSAFKEGRVLTSFTINTDRSYERKPGGTSGSGQDTDDNRSDFLVRTPGEPQNAGFVPSPEAGGVKIVHIDVGQGDATLIIGPSKSLLFDAGRTGSGAQIRSILNSNNLTSIDYFVAGHYHEDHIGGIDELVNSGVPINVASYDRAGSYSSQAFDQYVNAVGTKRTTINLNQQIDLGGGCVVTSIAVNGHTLHGTMSSTDENARSIALVLRFGTFDYFIGSDLTGGGLGTDDMESWVALAAGDVDIMRVSHHGSQTSTNQTFINTLHPEQAVISVGDGNSYGHPTQAVLDRLSAATNVNTIWQTELGTGGTASKVRVGGNIVFVTNGFAYSVSTSIDTQTYGFPTDGVGGNASLGPPSVLGGQYFAAVRWPVLVNGSGNRLAEMLGYEWNLCCQGYRHSP